MKKNPFKFAVLLAIIVLTLVGMSSKVVQAPPTQDKIWMTSPGDVDWDSTLENVHLVINDGDVYAPGGWSRGYLWVAPFIVAEDTIRGVMGVMNLREQVYWHGVRVLDEGWWDEDGVKQSYLYYSKYTIQSGLDVVTTWEREWTGFQNGLEYHKSVTLTRTVYERSFVVGAGAAEFRAFVVEYKIEFCHDPDVNDPIGVLPSLAGHLGFGTMWHATAESGDASTSLGLMEDAMTVYQLAAPGWRGIIDSNLRFELSYTFDDAIKTWSSGPTPNICLIGWDGATSKVFQAQSPPIYYEDDDYSPLADVGYQDNGSPAIFGMVYPPSTWWVRVRMDIGYYNGVGPIGTEAQRVHITFACYLDVNGDGIIDIIDITLVAKNYHKDCSED